MRILSIVQHQLSDEQIKELFQLGYDVVELRYSTPLLHEMIGQCPGNVQELNELAGKLVSKIKSYDGILLPGGSPAFQAILIDRLSKEDWGSGIVLFFSHSERISNDVIQEDGSVQKISKFKHLHFIALKMATRKVQYSVITA